MVPHHAVLAGRGREVLSALLEAGADVAGRDRDGRTALAVAHRAGHRVAIDRLLEAGARAEDVEPVDRVVAAATAGDAVELGRLLAAAPDVGFAYRRSDHQMLCWAIRRGRSEVVPLLLRAGLDPRVRDDDGHTPLALAAAAGDPSTVAALLSAGAPPDDRDFDGGSALERALENRDETGRAEVVRALLGAGAGVGELRGFPTGDARLDEELRRGGAVEAQDDDASFERAVDAVVDGDTDALGQLLEEEPELVLRRSARPHRATLLHYVAANGVEDHRQRTPAQAPQILAMLLAAGAEPDALCLSYGGGPAQTALSLLVSSDHPARAGVQGELTRILCRAGARPDGLDGDGVPMATAIAFRSSQAIGALAPLATLDNPLFAAAAGRRDLLEAMVDPGGRVRPGVGCCRVPWLRMSRDPGEAAEQALICGACFGHLDVVGWLCERGVDPDGAPVHGRSALHEAAFMGHLEVVGFLLERGADPGRREEQFGATPLGWAREAGRRDVMERILAFREPDIYDAVDLGLVESARRILDREPSLIDAPAGKGGLLRCAASRGDEAMVRLLLGRGANRELTGESGETALDLARRAGHDAVIRLLE